MYKTAGPKLLSIIVVFLMIASGLMIMMPNAFANSNPSKSGDNSATAINVSAGNTEKSPAARQPNSVPGNHGVNIPLRFRGLNKGVPVTPWYNPSTVLGSTTTNQTLYYDCIMQNAKEHNISMKDIYLPNLNAGSMFNNLTNSSYIPVGPSSMGVSDHGVDNVSGTLTPYTYNTSSFEGTFTANSFSSIAPNTATPSNVSIQLNAVLNNVTLFGASKYDFWTQNVISYSTRTHQLCFIDNIWNFTGQSFTENSIYSHGPGGVITTGTGGFYYALGPTLTVSYPFSVTLYLNSTVIAGRSAVFFNYSISSGGVTTSSSYDEVIFNSTYGQPSGFSARAPDYVVSGTIANPLNNLPNDAELIIGGPGGGSGANVYTLNGTFRLQYYNKTTDAYSNIRSAYDFGMDTGESSDGVAVSWSNSKAILNAGPSLLYGMWNVSSVTSMKTYSGTISPSNALLFVNNGSKIDNATAAWTPTSLSGSFSFALPSGPYVAEALMSEYGNSTFTLSTNSVITLSPDTVNGVYTPLVARSEAQLGNISKSGTGSSANPYVLFNTGPKDISSIFAKVNDYLFPEFPGILITDSSAYVDVNNMEQFNASGSTSYGQSFNVHLPLLFLSDSNVNVSNSAIMGSVTFAASSNYEVIHNTFYSAELVLSGSTGAKVGNNTFNFSSQSAFTALCLYNTTHSTISDNAFSTGYFVFGVVIQYSSNISVRGNDFKAVKAFLFGMEIIASPHISVFNNVMCNNGGFMYGVYLFQSSNSTVVSNHLSFIPNPASPPTQSSFFGILDFESNHTLIASNTLKNVSDGIVILNGSTNYVWGNIISGNISCITPTYGVLIGSPGNTIYNNFFGAGISYTAVTFNPNSASIYSASISPYPLMESWNITDQSASNAHTFDGYTLSGSIIGTSYQGGNYWWNYNGTKPYNDGGMIPLGGDYVPLVSNVVTFSETGLPVNHEWNVTLNGSSTSGSRGSTVVFNLVNGTYSFRISSKGFVASPREGMVSVTGSMTVSLVFKKGFAVNFTESGFPNGGYNYWFMTLNGTKKYSNSSVIQFYELNGTLQFSTGPVYSNYSVEYFPQTQSGSVTVSGFNQVVPIKFEKGTQITFFAVNLTVGAQWSVSLSNGQTFNTTSNIICFYEPNGTYQYSVTSAEASMHPVVNTGILIASGNSIQQLVYFTGQPIYKVTFAESGLPAGSGWYLSARDNTNGYIQWDNFTSSISMVDWLINGSYSYSANSSNNLYAALGSFSVNGAAITVTITFNKAYQVTFSQTGLPAGDEWYVCIFNGTTGAFLLSNSSVGPSLMFSLMNGSYIYQINAPGTGRQAVPSSATFTINGAGATFGIQFKKAYHVTFSQTGLPAGDGWYVYIFNESTTTYVVSNNSFGTYLMLDLANGSYSYEVFSYNSSWHPSPSAGTFTVTGSPVSIPVTFSQQLYRVSFVESKLPAGTLWYVNLSNGLSNSSTSTTITFNLVNGSYTYFIASSNKNWGASPSTGPFTVNGSPLSISTTFSETKYTVTFSESGLPSGTVWYVNLSNGASGSSSSGFLTFSLVNGSYTYYVSSSNKLYAPLSYSGSLDVNGSAVQISITFSLVEYPITFHENGLPPGVTWYVYVTNSTGHVFSSSSNTNGTTLLLINGTYTYTFASANKDYYNHTIGTMVFSGGTPSVVSVKFIPYVSTVTFTESGLPSGTAWYVNLTNDTGYVFNGHSTTSTIVFNLVNG
ncbi:MAG: thermopsin family protease, partial [Candidatus Thermoplasmatota archaeon]|nr:thermopsin family protease [Candidatus Thermoplasmatota archaeon]